MSYKDEGESRRFQRYEKPKGRPVRIVEPERAKKEPMDATSLLVNAFTVLILVALASYGLLVWLTRK